MPLETEDATTVPLDESKRAELARITEGLRQAEAGEFASAEEVAAAYRRFKQVT